MSEKRRNELTFTLWGVLIHIANFIFTGLGISMLTYLKNSDLVTPLGYLLVFRGLVVFIFWCMIWTDYDFSTKPRKLSALEKAQREINRGEYKKQLKEDKKELERRKGISRELKYIERAIVSDAKCGSRVTYYNIPVDYCEKDVELYLQNHGFQAEIDYNEHTHNSNLQYCHVLRIEW